MATLHLRMRHRVRRDRTEPSSNALASLRDACARARVKRAPALIVTDAVRAPALFGIVRPAILLPRELAASCDPASLNLILLHELAHLQRRDLWAQVAAALLIAAALVQSRGLVDRPETARGSRDGGGCAGAAQHGCE